MSKHRLWDCRQIIYREHKGFAFESLLDPKMNAIRLDKKHQTGSELPVFVLIYTNLMWIIGVCV